MKKNNVVKSDDVQDEVSDEESYIDYAKRQVPYSLLHIITTVQRCITSVATHIHSPHISLTTLSHSHVL